MKILHLSDLHFRDIDISQDIVLDSLYRKINELVKKESKPNVLIITGDIAYSGKAEQYRRAEEFIDSIAKACQIERTNIFLIPGNHDVDRSKIKEEHLEWWYSFQNEKSVTKTLNSAESFPIINEKSKNYIDFCTKYMTGVTHRGRFGEFVQEVSVKGEKGKMKVKIVGLNSSLFCGYDGDEKQRLALGLEQVSYCDGALNSEEEIIISCIHHPKSCFHICDKAAHNRLNKFSDLILSGHIHEARNEATRNGNTGATVFITAGASYDKREHENGFNIIELDLNTLKGKATIYKYLHEQHEWILNKDINAETNGIFPFEIAKQNGHPVTKIEMIAPTAPTQNYMAVVNVPFDELNRERVNAILNELMDITGDINIKITKVEKGSVKIYFESIKDIPVDVKSSVEQLQGTDILEIRKTGEEFNLKSVKPDKSVYHWRTFIKKEFFENIQSVGATFTHSRVDDLALKDLFVPPNLKVISIGDSKTKVDKIVNSEEALAKKPETPIKFVIYGADNSGKTTLTRWWYDKYYEQGYIPILFSGNDVKDISISRIKKLVQREFHKQYDGVHDGNLDDYESDRIIVMIDDFHKIRFTKSKYKANLISNLNKCYSNVFLTSSEFMMLETYTSKTGNARNIFEDFHRYQIIEFGPKLRYELIKKWNGLGIEQLEPNELIRLNNETENHVESIIGKNFVPSYPVYLLTILQARELTNIKPEYSLHGFYYELLINEALNKAVSNKGDISLFYNFITDYCYFLFDHKIRFEPLFINDFLKFHSNYCQEYNIKISPNYILDTLVKSKLLKLSNETVSISYKYVYYFFVARYLGNNTSSELIKNKIKSLCQRVHRDEFSSIVMFLTHLSKDQFIIEQLIENSKTLFSEYKPIKLEEDVSFINEMISKLPEQIYQPIDVETIKEEELKEEEELDLQEKEFNSSKDVYNYDLEEDISTLDALSKMLRAVKTIEIVGQVTKKYWGELKAQQKFNLAEETYMLGLRTLGFYFSLIEKDPEMLIEYLKHIYLKKHLNKNISKEEIDKASRNFLFGLCVMASFGVIKRVTNAIGYEKLAGTFSDILKAHDYTAVKLIDTSIKLDYNQSFPWPDIKLLKKDTDRHFLSAIVLKNLVINYLYVFYTSIEDKQKICSLMDIKIDQQRMIDATSYVKKENPN